MIKQTQERIQNTAATIAGFSSLAPSLTVNATFSDLVDIVTTTPSYVAATVLEQRGVQELVDFLRTKATIAETALEYHWANHFLTRPALEWSNLAEFPYFKNYQQLTGLELAALQAVASVTEPILFVGCGPLPLSALILAREYGYQVQCIDNDTKAVAHASVLVEKLGLSHLVRITSADITKHIPIEKTIILAAMVGSTEIEKKEVLERLQEVTEHDVTLITRDVEHLGQLLYTPVPVSRDWETVAYIKGRPEIINTLRILKKSV